MFRIVALIALLVSLMAAPGRPDEPAAQSGGPTAAEDRPNLVANGGFEEADEAGRPASWYFIRQARVESAAGAKDASDEPAENGDPSEPRAVHEGQQSLRFFNRTPGRDCQAQQVVVVDGRKVSAVRLSAWVRGADLGPGQELNQRGRLIVAWIDSQGQVVGNDALGPWAGSFDWREESIRVLVPPQTRRAVVLIGLMGGTGSLWIDAIEMIVEEGPG